MAECTGAFGHTRQVVPDALGADLVCFTCGSKIAPLIVFGDDGVDEAADVSESLSATATPPPPPPPPPRQQSAAKQARAAPKRPAAKPGLTHFKEVRRLKKSGPWSTRLRSCTCTPSRLAGCESRLRIARWMRPSRRARRAAFCHRWLGRLGASCSRLPTASPTGRWVTASTLPGAPLARRAECWGWPF